MADDCSEVTKATSLIYGKALCNHVDLRNYISGLVKHSIHSCFVSGKCSVYNII